MRHAFPSADAKQRDPDNPAVAPRNRRHKVLADNFDSHHHWLLGIKGMPDPREDYCRDKLLQSSMSQDTRCDSLRKMVITTFRFSQTVASMARTSAISNARFPVKNFARGLVLEEGTRKPVSTRLASTNCGISWYLSHVSFN